MKPTVGSLFSGIGGIEFAFEEAGFQTSWQVEIDAYCRKVLERHFHDAERFDDVRRVGSGNLRRVNVIVGGFPCQDISVAGKGEGITGKRSGLWSEYRRIIGELRPDFVLVENVAALLGRGMGRVLGDLSALGYDAEWDDISAADLGAWHIRNRIWIVAYPKRFGYGRSPAIFDSSFYEERDLEARKQRRNSWSGKAVSSSEEISNSASERCREAGNDCQRPPQWVASGGDVSNSNTPGCEILEGCETNSQRQRIRTVDGSDRTNGGLPSYAYNSEATRLREYGGEIYAITKPKRPFGGDSEGWWSTEPGVGRVANGVPNRVDRLRGLGNSVVPVIPYLIAKRILALIIRYGLAT